MTRPYDRSLSNVKRAIEIQRKRQTPQERTEAFRKFRERIAYLLPTRDDVDSKEDRKTDPSNPGRST